MRRSPFLWNLTLNFACRLKAPGNEVGGVDSHLELRHYFPYHDKILVEILLFKKISDLKMDLRARTWD